MDYSCEKIAIKIKQLVKEEGTTLKTMLKDLNLGTNLVYQLSYGSSITAINLAKIADYLGCSVDYLLGRSEIRNTEQSDEEIVRQFNALSPSDQEAALKFIRFLKNEEQN